ncbi:hypothetical protein ABZ949_05300 [Micromonospora tulbaghiae]|uniref:hypothetical protein n=1 Tax=Micromonospora tulbaghiae TaxID=479978 RepID=UPI00340DBC59
MTPAWVRDGQPYEPTPDELAKAERSAADRRPPAWQDPATMPELAAMATAVKRGTKRSALRLLDISCPADHRIGEVFPSAAGPILLTPRKGAGALRLNEVGVDVWLRLPCRCSINQVPVEWIRSQLAAARRRRVIWS